MARRATVEDLRRPRTKTVTVDVQDVDTDEWVPTEFVIQRVKAGHRKQLQADCVDADGLFDLEHATRLACALCTIDPDLSEDDVEHMDLDVLVELGGEITKHSNHRSIREMATPDPEEGAEAVKSFRLEGPEPVGSGGVDAEPADAADRVDG